MNINQYEHITKYGRLKHFLREAYRRWWFWLLIVVLLLFYVGEINGEEDADIANGTEAEAGIDSYSVGETATVGDLEFTLHSARWDEGYNSVTPGPGERWLIIDGEVENNGDDPFPLTSLLMLQLFDEDNISRDITLFAETEGVLDGTVGPGRAMRGELPFKVREGQTRWELVFEPDMLGSEQIIFEINIDDINNINNKTH